MQKLKTDVHEWAHLIFNEGRKGINEKKGHLLLHYMVSGQLGSQLDGLIYISCIYTKVDGFKAEHQFQCKT